MSNNMPWQVESFRFTLLEVAGKDFPTIEELVGIAAESRMERPAQKMLTEVLMWESGQLTVTSQPMRYDFVYSFVPATPDLPNLGEFESVVKTLQPMLDEILKIPAPRLAVGLVFNQSAASHKDSYLALDGLIPEVKVDSSTSDFLYRINRPVESKAANGVRINRIATWGAMMMQFFAVGAQGASVDNKYGVRVELDINTAPETPIKDGVTGAIFEEILSLASSYLGGKS